MRKLADYKGEEGINKLADLLELAAEIMTDQEVVNQAQNNRLKAVRAALKNHPKAVLTIMAILADENPETYEPPMLALPAMLLNLFNDPDVVSLFTLQGQSMANNPSGSAMANIEDDGK